MTQAINKEKIAYHIREILIALGDNPEREGLKETPERVAKMYEEVLEGMKYSNEEIAQLFGKTFEEEEFVGEQHDDFVVVKNIPIFSYCEHHLALMYNMKVSVIYKPTQYIIGLSKVARIAEMVGRRLQLQERIGADIANVMQMVTKSSDIGVVIEGEHSCMTARGIKKPGASTVTTCFKGIFEKDTLLRQEALLLMR